MEAVKKMRLLDSPRVLDLTDEEGYLCGKILADLGADVIKVEKPGGDLGRRRGPFYKDIPHPEKSLFWFAFNVNKRGITLDIETKDGCALFKKLAQTADFVIESFPPGYMDGIGLGYSLISSVRPEIIMTSITPFGQNGPHKDWKGSDIVGMATGGFMFMVGDLDKSPMRISVDQASLHACSEGAVASLIAYYERQRKGLGQYIDVSIQASVVPTTLRAIPHWEIGKGLIRRSGPYRAGIREGGQLMRNQWPCKDGTVTYVIWGGATGARSNQALVEWMREEGFATDFLNGMDWANFDAGAVSDETLQRLEEPIGRFFLVHTKAELFKRALEKRIQLYPVYNIEEFVDSPQQKSREFWVSVEHPELNDIIIYPGAFAKSSEVALETYRRAPLIGEHNIAVYGDELGLSHDELITLKEAGVI